MPQLSEKLMNTAKSLGGFFKKPTIGPGATGGSNNSPSDLLGQIYNMMIKVQEEQDIDHELHMKEEKKKEKNESDRNAALIKALTARKKPKVKKPPKKKEEPKKPEEKKPEPKKEEPKKETKKTPEKKVEEKKKEDKVKKQVDKESEKAKEQAQKEAEKAKKTAEKEQAAAKKKVEEEAKQKAEPVKPPETKPPKAEPAPAPKAPETKPSVTKLPTGNVAKATLIAALAAEGYSHMAQANILANVKEESNFIPHSENIGRYNATNLFALYGPPDQEFVGRHGSGKGQKLIANPKNQKGKHNTVRFNTIEDAEKLVSQGPEAVAEVMYGGRMGNKNPGDGFKYIGRGFIQLTGKENYEKVGKLIGVDLVNNPELANDPVIAAKIVPAFFKAGGKRPKDLEDIDKAIEAVGSASVKSRTERKRIAAEYQKESPGFGEKIDTASKENADLNANLEKQQGSTTVNNVNPQPTQQPTQSQKQAKQDDRSPMQRKMQG